jgi:hypothetical protein
MVGTRAHIKRSLPRTLVVVLGVLLCVGSANLSCGDVADNGRLGSHESPASNTQDTIRQQNAESVAPGVSDDSNPSVVIVSGNRSVDIGGGNFQTYTPPQHPIFRAFHYAEAAKPKDYIYLCLSIVSCVLAFFMLYQSIALQKKVTKNQEDAPDPESGAGISWLLFWLVFGIFCFYWIANAQSHTGTIDPRDFFERHWWGAVLGSPRAFASPFLIASIAPSVIAIYKFGLAIAMSYSRRARMRGITRFAVGAVVKEDAPSVLVRIEENVNSLKSRLSDFESKIAAGGRGGRVNDEAEEKRTTDIRYFVVLTFVFVAIFATTSVVYALTKLPFWSVIALGSFAAFVWLLVVVFDLSKGGQISEKSLMQVVRRALNVIAKIISRRDK